MLDSPLLTVPPPCRSTLSTSSPSRGSKNPLREESNLIAHLKDHGPVDSQYPFSFLILPGRSSAAAPVQRWGRGAALSLTKDLSAEKAPVIHRDVHSRTLAGWQFLLSIVVLAGLIGAPEARAQHICDLAGYECHPAEAGPWSIRVVTSNLIPVTARGFRRRATQLPQDQPEYVFPRATPGWVPWFVPAA